MGLFSTLLRRRKILTVTISGISALVMILYTDPMIHSDTGWAMHSNDSDDVDHVINNYTVHENTNRGTSEFCRNVAINGDLLLRSLSFLLMDPDNRLMPKFPANHTGHPIRFLPMYRSSCWKESVPRSNFSYPASVWNTEAWRGSTQRADLRRQQHKMEEFINHRISGGDPVRFRCLPHVFVLGVFKAGTSNFFRSLSLHHHVARPAISEPDFWTQLPRSNVTFTQYLDIYDRQADWIVKEHVNGYHPMMTLDASTGTFQGYTYKWSPWTAKSDLECVTLPQHLRYLAPDTRYIILLRHPVDWMRSCYNHFARLHKHRHSSDDLHASILKGILRFNNCMNETNADDLQCFHRRVADDPCVLENLLYYVFVREWIETVGRENVIVINSNQYFLNKVEVLSKVLKFLGLGPYNEKSIKKLNSRKIVPNAHSYSRTTEMYNSSKQLLMNFLKPWNKKLANYVEDESLLWNG